MYIKLWIKSVLYKIRANFVLCIIGKEIERSDFTEAGVETNPYEKPAK